MTVTLHKMGHFYEIFDDAARRLTVPLQSTLTVRNGRAMIGIPYWGLDRAMADLRAMGEDPVVVETAPKPQRRFEVFIGACVVDAIYCDADMTAREVRKALIDSGRPSSISVYKLADGRYRYEDCARVTHPEEL